MIPRAQEELLHNVFDFAGREVRDVMVPAPDVVWLEAAMTASEALEVVVETPHARYPVGRESLDHLVGIVHFRDLIASPEATVGELARPAIVSDDQGPRRAAARAARGSASRWRSWSTSTAARRGS